MANFTGITSSSGIEVDLQQKEEFDHLCLEKYYFSMEDVSFGEDGVFGIWGYDWLDVLPYKEDGEPDYDNRDGMELFFEDVRKLLKDDQVLIIQCVGNEKTRFPLAAMQIKVTKEKVEWFQFPD